MADGRPAREAMDLATRAKLYFDLAEAAKQGPWHYTYVKAKGNVAFRGVDKPWNVDE